MYLEISVFVLMCSIFMCLLSLRDRRNYTKQLKLSRDSLMNKTYYKNKKDTRQTGNIGPRGVYISRLNN